MPETIDLTPLYDTIIPLLTAIIGTVLAAILYRVQKFIEQETGLKFDREYRDNIETALRNALTYASSRINEMGEAEGWHEIQIKNEVIRQMVSYVLERVPDSARHFGLTPTSVEQLVRSRLEAVWDQAHIGTATRPTTPQGEPA